MASLPAKIEYVSSALSKIKGAHRAAIAAALSGCGQY
jgi:hypothetical protein